MIERDKRTFDDYAKKKQKKKKRKKKEKTGCLIKKVKEE